MAKIEQVKCNKKANNEVWEIVYKSGTVKSVINGKLPRNAEYFIILAKHRDETRRSNNEKEIIFYN